MRALEIYGDTIKEANAFVRELDESIRLAAFNFLMTVEGPDCRLSARLFLSPRFNKPTALCHHKSSFINVE